MSRKRILWVGIPFALLGLPALVFGFLFALAKDASDTGRSIYDDIGKWIHK